MDHSDAEHSTAIKRTTVASGDDQQDLGNNNINQVLNTSGQFFTDSFGRVTNLRGVNLSGSTKLPYNPKLPTHVLKSFYESERVVSFVNRPFPLDEADEHLGRLAHWGFNFIRLNVTWEAIEHFGPKQYDDDYINYVIKLLYKMKQHGIRCFIDPHQDVWSRFTGGSGAPAWTLRVVGFELENLTDTYAAILHQTYHDTANFPKMIWPTNYTKLACATMFTLFFGGKTFAPKCVIDGMNIQDYLQSHYIQSISFLAKEIAKHPDLLDIVVVGYDTLNEPSNGFIGLKDIRIFPSEFDLKHGNTPTPFQCMLLGEGHPVTVDYYDFTWAGPRKSGIKQLDPGGKSAWTKAHFLDEYQMKPLYNSCIWADHGVWDQKSKTCLIPDYFSKDPKTGRTIEFLEDFWKPFVHAFTQEIRKVHPRTIIFIEPPVQEHPPYMYKTGGDVPSHERYCYAPHFYDGLTLMTKRFNRWYNVDVLGVKRGKYFGYATAVKFGEKGVVNCFRNQLDMIKHEGLKYLGNYPCVIGEIGIPYDMNDKEAYVSGDYSTQIRAMDANLQALEAGNQNFTLWNYCSDNNNRWGDNWNGEDLSIYSKVIDHKKTSLSDVQVTSDSLKTVTLTDQNLNQLNLNSSQLSINKKEFFGLDKGGRAVQAFCRPFPVHTAGIPRSLAFNIFNGLMTFTYSHSSSNGLKSLATEFYIPRLHYPTRDRVDIWTSDRHAKVELNLEKQRVIISCSCSLDCLNEQLVHTVIFKRKGRDQKSIDKWIEERGKPITYQEIEEGYVCPACNIM